MIIITKKGIYNSAAPPSSPTGVYIKMLNPTFFTLVCNTFYNYMKPPV